MWAHAFMIRDKETGLFRTKKGTWTKNGHTWRTLGHVKSHLKGHGIRDTNIALHGWEIVVLEQLVVSRDITVSEAVQLGEPELIELIFLENLKRMIATTK